jgi:lipopolysaccharide transport system permease protein
MTQPSGNNSAKRPGSSVLVALGAAWSVLYRHHALIHTLVTRDIDARVRGTVLGKIWIVVSPLFMLAIYTLVFGVILGSRWQDRTDEAFLFPLIYFSGLILFNFFFESISRATNLMRENETFIKKIVFPTEVFCFAAVGSSLFRFAIGFLILTVFYLAIRGVPPAAALAYPLLLLGLGLFTIGLSLALAGLGVFLRDLAHLMQPLSMLLIFLSPLFYPLERVPEGLRAAVMINPLTYPLEATRNALFFGEWPSLMGVSIYLTLGWITAALGYALFMRLSAGFADVL